MSLSDYRTITFNGLYTNIMRQFIAHGDKVYLLSPLEKKTEYNGESVICENGSTIVKFRIGNIQKTNLIEKGINTVAIDGKYIAAIKKYLSNIKFDLVIYPTPPITLLRVIDYVKRRDDAKTYLLLKDIFPQNAVDIGIMSTSGIKGLLYKYFRRQEKKLYAVSDYIGCMSEANVQYVISHNKDVDPKKIEVCPNTMDPTNMSCSEEERVEIRKKYEIPLNKKVFVYGGNLGRPQGIPFIIECLRKCASIKNAYFLIVGSGTEYGKIERFVDKERPSNVKLMQRLQKEDYDKMIGGCDVGLLFLDHRFTIPNFPSRMLSYMAAKLPILACTDPNTDVGEVIVNGGFGWWCESDNSKVFAELVEKIVVMNICIYGERGHAFLKSEYDPKKAYDIIVSSITKQGKDKK